MKQLRSERRGAALGKATSMVIFVHGYGAGGADLIDLADVMAPHLPNTVFYSPDAPLPENNPQPMGRMWFPIPWLDNSTEADARAGLAAASADLNGFLEDKMRDEGLMPKDVFLVGFSQGAMLSLHLAPRRPTPLAGVVSIAGRLLDGDTLAAEKRSTMPILLIHGDQDPVVSYESMAAAAQMLGAQGFAPHTYTMAQTGHGISNEGLGMTLGFVRELSQAPPRA